MASFTWESELLRFCGRTFVLCFISSVMYYLLKDLNHLSWDCWFRFLEIVEELCLMCVVLGVGMLF